MMSDEISVEREIAAEHVRSLVWVGDELVDWVAGGHHFTLDGRIIKRLVNYAYKFDAAIVSPSGKYTVLIAQTGTVAVLLCDGEVVKQLNRDWYCAHVHLYPITFAQLPDGREFLIHCPKSYCQLEIEDLVTGEQLPCPVKRKSPDIFHSRLACSPGGKWLISAGWCWHPFGMACLFALDAAIADPASLDRDQQSPPGSWDLASAVFIDDDTVLIGTSDQFLGDEDSADDNQPGRNRIAVWKIGASRYERSVEVGHSPGTLMPIGDKFAVSFYEYPRLISLETGAVVREWPHIDSGTQTDSIAGHSLPPPIAMDPQGARFAVRGEKKIHVVEFNRAELEKP